MFHLLPNFRLAAQATHFLAGSACGFAILPLEKLADARSKASRKVLSKAELRNEVRAQQRSAGSVAFAGILKISQNTCPRGRPCFQ
jgi:hypothetical protein